MRKKNNKNRNKVANVVAQKAALDSTIDKNIKIMECKKLFFTPVNRNTSEGLYVRLDRSHHSRLHLLTSLFNHPKVNISSYLNAIIDDHFKRENDAIHLLIQEMYKNSLYNDFECDINIPVLSQEQQQLVKEYKNKFLIDINFSTKDGFMTYLTSENHSRIMKISAMLANCQVTIFSIVHHIVSEHFNRERDTLQSIYQELYKPLF